MKYLFLFTIGPVKGFIENSRKAMDLYAGSRILSELMLQAAKKLAGEKNVQILVPLIPESPAKDAVNIPNRIVADFDGYSQDEMRKTAEALAQFVKNRFSDLCRDMLEEAKIEQEGTELAKKQWRDFLEIYWMYEEYGPPNYPQVYEKLHTEIEQVKEVRLFSQNDEPWGRKCMLFPAYNAIFAKKSKHGDKIRYPDHINPKCVYDITKNAYLRYAVKPNEALSSLALVKRIYGKTVTEIYSTRSMLLKSKVTEQMFLEAGICSSDGEQLDMTANAVYDLEHGNDRNEDEYGPREFEKAKKLLDIIKKSSVKLCSYYAIIKFDGDSMGDAFRELKTAAEQQELSKQISRFANEVPDVIKQYGGLPVFAGGEDFLGFLPLSSLFDCVKVLHKSFLERIRRTFSMGISIAHLMQPLKAVMEYADRMEASAKRTPDKNAFAVSIIKRSGNHILMPAYKLTAERAAPQWNDVGELVQILNQAQCSRSMLYTISDLFQCFTGEHVKPEDQLAEALLRNSVEHSAASGDQANKEELVKRIMQFYKNAAYTEDFLQTMDGILFLAREVV